jgi:DNA-binding NarL/FixJ family response regulator
MVKKYTVLIVDDHPLITEAYKSALVQINEEVNEMVFSIKIANNIDSALKIMKKEALDLVFLDIRLPPSSDGEILSGEDLGIRINEKSPKPKIIISTTFNDNYRIHSIFKSLDPEGFLIKNDITPDELLTAVKTVINDPPYYSKTVIKLLRNEVSSDFLLDKIDRQLLYELSVGTKMKDLPNVIPLSIAGIEKRKRHLKVIFDVEKQDDKALIMMAKEKGFI